MDTGSFESIVAFTRPLSLARGGSFHDGPRVIEPLNPALGLG